MTFANRLVDSFDSIFLTLVMVWFVGAGASLAQAGETHERQGTVEIHALASAADVQPSGV